MHSYLLPYTINMIDADFVNISYLHKLIMIQILLDPIHNRYYIKCV